MKRIIQLTLILALVAGLSGYALSTVYHLTKPTIDANAHAQEMASLAKFYPEVKDFKIVDENVNEQLMKVYQSKDIIICQLKVKGYKEGTTFLVSFENKKLTHYLAISNGDTKGLGSKVMDSDFKKKIEAGKLDTISGATISSQPVIDGIRLAQDYVDQRG